MLYKNHRISQNWVKVEIEDFVQFKIKVKSFNDSEMFRNLKNENVLKGTDFFVLMIKLHLSSVFRCQRNSGSIPFVTGRKRLYTGGHFSRPCLVNHLSVKGQIKIKLEIQKQTIVFNSNSN